MQRILKISGIIVGLVAISALGIYTSRYAFKNQSYELNQLP